MNTRLVVEVIAWASEAAREHVELAIFNHETPDPESGMGLWQSFQAKFPKAAVARPRDYDTLIGVYLGAYSSTVKTLVAFRPDGGRAAIDLFTYLGLVFD